MDQARRRRPRPPLDAAQLADLAMAYVGRFATTRARLALYLQRKVRERGWAGAGEPDIAQIVERLAGFGFVDDQGFALGRARALAARGLGAERLRQSLRAAGVAAEDSIEAREHAESVELEALVRLAERRRLGPFAVQPVDRAGRERALAALIRAGHSMTLARALLDLEPRPGLRREDVVGMLER